MITQAVGSGTFVCGLPDAATAPITAAPAFDGNVSPAELMVARRLIEPLMPGLIVRNATAGDFAAMQHCIERSEAASTIEEFEHWDGALHTALAVTTHNGFFVHILKLTQRVRDQREWGRLKAKSLNGPRRAQYEQPRTIRLPASGAWSRESREQKRSFAMMASGNGRDCPRPPSARRSEGLKVRKTAFRTPGLQPRPQTLNARTVGKDEGSSKPDSPHLTTILFN